ncbi:MAG TPA: glycerophosphodiester phosphodiesterase family protein [Anaerolineales bacterium]|nr:glycerophosphodiester phosphodiesterase family protein [Anaerolineales bacterium]
MKSHGIIRVAHRGASALYPENTRLAYYQAIEQGVDMLEIDIQRTADGELVVIHDSTLERTTNGHGLVNQHSLQEIRQLDAGQGEKVPLLTEVIQLAREAQVRLCVEIKGTSQAESLTIAEAIVQTLEAADFLSQAIVTSFSSAALIRAKALNPEVSTMLDPSPQDGSLSPREICTQALRAGANCLSYDFRFLTPDVVGECRLTGLALWPWDPDEPTDIQQVLGWDVQAVLTNRPDILNQVLNDSAI